MKEIRMRTRKSWLNFLECVHTTTGQRNMNGGYLRGRGGCGGTGSSLGPSGVLGIAGTEAVVESSGDVLEVLHAAGTGGLSSLGLLGPVVFPGLSSWVSARCTSVLLDVEGSTTTTTAQDVRLVVAFTERAGTLGHLGFLGVAGVVAGGRRCADSVVVGDLSNW